MVLKSRYCFENTMVASMVSWGKLLGYAFWRRGDGAVRKVF